MNRLRLVHRDLRVTLSTLQPNEGLRASEFARTMMARHLRRTLDGPPSYLVFYQGQPLSIYSPVYQRTDYASAPQHITIYLAPRLQLTLLRGARSQPNPSSRPAPQPVLSIPTAPGLSQRNVVPTWQIIRQHVSQLRTEMLMQRLNGRVHTEETITEQLTRRLLTRAQPIDSVMTPDTKAASRSYRVNASRASNPQPAGLPAIPGAKPVSRVVRRPASWPAGIEETSPFVSDSSRARSPVVFQSTVIGAQSHPMAPVDVNRLTDQVMQTLDRRLLAYRERTGRI